MALNIQTFSQLVQTQAAAIQSAASQAIDFATGSIMRALVQANAAICLWLESLIVQVLALTRAATSSGSDLDSWMADFGLTRLAAAYASGTVTFSRYTSTASGFVPVGAQVQTSDKSQTFTVTADPTNSAYSATLNGYTLSAGVSSLGILCQASTAGVSGNAAAGTITVIYGALAGIDYVSNAGSFSGGVNAEADSAFRARFVSYLQTLSKATPAAIQAAIASLQAGAYCSIVEGYNYAGTATPSFFYAVADDGSGDPPGSFISAAQSAVNLVRAAGVSFAVYAPVVVTASVNMTVTTDPSYVHSVVTNSVIAALTSYINSLQLGQTLAFTRLAQIAYDTSPGVLNVSGVTLNGGTSDLTTTPVKCIKALTITVA